MAEFGALSLVPPLLAIGLAVVTRRPMLSLFLDSAVRSPSASGRRIT